ncbi:Selenocysteine synthase [seryl-tRNASer selenium transferase] [Pasteurella testudinis DSM 23072]|uniref:Selenocysteine synthase [seryl-tRNASer selenium transferase] n=1 Tax=Pasteurella testudinis DSM 23072 TaxID=1122938 RepID=A0A1W1UHA5_9PAST|nr:aminotransferase class V-fold PLP-dependent enzyme [Pasteurella testudinis]SMB80154.1 Selenocysteine synthase [seryl-tRNASer selenium transferase] [Pasteurella testudinis DSM 23072]SUB50586.1 methionine gamma-lyase [Pasteurella testudinis]
MPVYPLTSLSLEQAKQKQFALVEAITRRFQGAEFLQSDLGLKCGLNQPQTTRQVEQVLADFFQAQSAVLLQGAGTGALRAGLTALLRHGEKIVLHRAPIYPTSKTSIELLGLQVIEADFNHLDQLAQVLASTRPAAVLIQHSRQQPQDRYHLAEVIAVCRQAGVATLIDDNYAVMKVDKIGCELGATLSTFSSFKLFGPEGVGVAVGEQSAVDKIRRSQYSGGCQIQGWQAQAVLRGLVFAPVMHAIQAEQGELLVARLNSDEFPMVTRAFLVNAQSKVVIVELDQPIAEQVIAQAQQLGALPHPVGAESKYEIPPLFYRVSATFLQADPHAAKRSIRINPNRSGCETVLRILQQSYRRALTAT